MAITRAQMMKERLPGLNGLFGLEYKEYADECAPIYGSPEGSNRSFEEEVKLAGFGPAGVKSEGSSIAYDSSSENYTARYTHETVAKGFAITEEAIEDNLYDTLAMRYTKALARAMAHTKQTKGAFPLNNAFDTTNFTAGDSAALCSAHTLADGSTVSNVLAVAADLSETSLEQAAIDISAFTDERGLLVAAMPQRLIIHSSNQFSAARILKSDLRSGSADNDLNALRTSGTIPGGYFVNHYLSSANSREWFIITDVPDGMKHFQRTAIKQEMDGDFSTGNVRYKARERYSFGVSDYLGIFGSGELA